MAYVPKKPSKADDHSVHHVCVHERVFEGKGLIIAGDGIVVTPQADGAYKIQSLAKSTPGGSGWDWMYPDHKELDPTLAYSKGKAAYISPNNDLVANGRFDPVALTMVTSVAGIWLCVKDVPTQTSTTYLGAAVYQYNLPQLPYPGATGTPTGSAGNLKGDLDGSNLYWVYLGQAPTCFGQ